MAKSYGDFVDLVETFPPIVGNDAPRRLKNPTVGDFEDDGLVEAFPPIFGSDMPSKDLAAACLQITFTPPANGDQARLTKDLEYLLGVASNLDCLLGGEGFERESQTESDGVVSMILKPKALDGAEDRLEKIAAAINDAAARLYSPSHESFAARKIAA